MKIETVRQYRREISISFVLLCGALSMGIVRPMLPLYLTDINLTTSTIGLIVAVSMAGMIVCESLSGLFADRFGLLFPLILSTLICGLILYTFTLVKAIPLLLLVSLVWGGLRALMIAPARSYMAGIAPPHRKATYIAITGAILSLSRGVGALPGGLIADNLGFDWVFYIGGAVAIAGCISFFGFRKSPASPNVKPVVVGVEKPVKKWLSTYLLLVIIGMLGFFNISIFLTYIPLLGTEMQGLSATQVGIIFTVNGLATMAFSLPGGYLADRFGKRTIMFTGLAACTLAMLLIAPAPGFSLLLGLGVLHALGMALFVTAIISMMTDFISQRQLATYIGLYGGVGENSGLMLGAMAGGFIWQWLGIPYVFISGAIACLIGIIIGILLPKVNPGGS